MPRLVLDESAMQMAMKKLSGSPILSGPNGAFLAPGVVDLVEDDGGHRWHPANALSRRVVLGYDACRDILVHTPAVIERRTRRRALKMLTVPVCSLVDVVFGLRKGQNDARSRAYRETWPARDQMTYTKAGRRLKRRRQKGPVRKVRNKLGAHLDPEAFETKLTVSADELLAAMGDALVLLKLSLNYPSDFFSWTRWLGKVQEDRSVVETMVSYPVCMRWVVDASGRVVDVLSIRLAEDPRHQIEPDLRAAVVAYNDMVEATDASQPRIFLRSTEELRALEEES